MESLTGILLDVSGSMSSNIGSGIDEEGGPWARSIFDVIDNLIRHDVSSDNHVFAIGVGASSGGGVFDVIRTVKQFQNQGISVQNTGEPATHEHINRIFHILERAGARTIRKWAGVHVVREALSDYLAVLFLSKFESDRRFLEEFVQTCLPPACRDWVEPEQLPSIGGLLFTVANSAYSAYASAVTCFKRAEVEDVIEVVEKAKSYLMKEVGVHSIVSVKEASDVLHGYVDKERELSKERSRELLRSIEPFIYGRTPLYESIEKATKLFEDTASKFSIHKKLLFILSDGDPTDGENTNHAGINRAVAKLTAANVTVVSCFITESTQITPRRLYSKMEPDWNPGAKFLFSLSSPLQTQSLPRTIFVKRGWIIDSTNNETYLFLQVNHPDNMREACEVARNVVCCQDVLSDLLASVDLDVYINQKVTGFGAKEQEGGTCYANASAAVLDLSMRRILGREGGYPDFYELRKEFIKRYGTEGANTLKVLQEMCPKYRLHCEKVDLKGAMKAITAKRPVVTRFRLTDDERDSFGKFFKSKPTGILTKKEIDITARPPNACTGGHAVVLTSFNSECLRLMNSWGVGWADQGFFKVQNADVLGLQFIDVFWTVEDLTEKEKSYYEKHGSQVARKLMNSYQALQRAEYTCPKCSRPSPVVEFTGTLLQAKCPKCSRSFSTNDGKGNILALNLYLTSLTHETDLGKNQND